MNRTLRRIERLEQMVGSDIRRRSQAHKRWQFTHVLAADHAAILAFIIQRGNPTIDEPLSAAGQRCEESEAWKRLCAEFWDWLRRKHDTFPFNPYTEPRAGRIGSVLRHMLIAELPGRDEKAKLEAALAAAPPWLLYYTFSDYTAKLLGLTLPDLSDVRRFERLRADFERWPGLPEGIFECRPWPNGAEAEPLAHTDLKLPFQPLEPDLRGMSPRQRRRALATYMKPQKYEQTWPPLVPLEHLKDPWGYRKRAAASEQPAAI
jgi:hypothetical protein